MNPESEFEFQVKRRAHMAEMVVFVDGLGGCGKTMFSPILSTFDRMELLTYTYEIEQICALYYLKKISKDASEAMIGNLSDLQLYNTMMSREINFRPSDLSSVWMNSNPLRYLVRLFQKGDADIPEKIRKKKPILTYTTHQLLGFSQPIFSALKERVVFFEVVRHPLYMIIQMAMNYEIYKETPRSFTMSFLYNDEVLPYYVKGWEELYLSSNFMEKAIYYIDQLTKIKDKTTQELIKSHNAKILKIPFEAFVLDPWSYIKQAEEIVGTKANSKTKKMMRRQRVPRKVISDSIPLAIYKRCGWEEPEFNGDENKELDKRRNYAIDNGAGDEAMHVLDRICKEYEEQYPH